MLNKKGSFISDYIVLIILSLVFIIFFGMMIYVGGSVFDGLLSNTDALTKIMGTEEKAISVVNNSIGATNRGFETLHWSSTFIILAMCLSILISSFLTRVHPIFYVVYFMLSAIFLIVSFPISNAYETLSTTPTLASTFAEFVGANYLLLHLPVVITITISLSIIILILSYYFGGDVTL